MITKVINRMSLAPAHLSRLQEIVDWLEAPAPAPIGDVVTFDMTTFIGVEFPDGRTYEDTDAKDEPNYCGTSACIAGCAIAFNYASREQALKFTKYHGAYVEGHPEDIDYEKDGALLLGLDYDAADALFYGHGVDGIENITRAWAAACLRHLMATGEVDWRGTMPPGTKISEDEDDYEDDHDAG